MSLRGVTADLNDIDLLLGGSRSLLVDNEDPCLVIVPGELCKLLIAEWVGLEAGVLVENADDVM